MIRKCVFAVDEYYHVYNRGNDKREIFLDDADRDRFIQLLFLCNSRNPVVIRDIPRGDSFVVERGETIADIGVYCLMPNHFHLLIREKDNNGITLFMRKVATGYSMYFNLKYKRTGKLFESVFKSSHADNDEYLRYLFAYIHLNPVKLIEPRWRESGITNPEQAINYLGRYPYSSFLDYREVKRIESSILDKASFPNYFSTGGDFLNYLQDWLSYPQDLQR